MHTLGPHSVNGLHISLVIKCLLSDYRDWCNTSKTLRSLRSPLEDADLRDIAVGVAALDEKLSADLEIEDCIRTKADVTDCRLERWLTKIYQWASEVTVRPVQIPREVEQIVQGCARGRYQLGLLYGSETWSGSSLRGKASDWGSRYAQSREGLINRIYDALPNDWLARVLPVGRYRKLTLRLVQKVADDKYIVYDWLTREAVDVVEVSP